MAATTPTEAELRCRCGEVRGRLVEAAPRRVNRVVCYCADCQAFLHHLGRADLLDAWGGSDIVQVAPAALRVTQGEARIAGLRLTAKGLYRWYAACCNTPCGNTVGPAIPFIGLMARSFGDAADALFGPPVGRIFGKFAVGTAPDAARGIPLKLMLRTLPLVVGWRLSGRAWPHPFFDRQTRAPTHPLRVLTPAERDALRPLCGPRP